jgi:hypothetical protein
MAKHHKKPSPAQTAKLLTAQNRRQFFNRFKNLLALLSDSHDLYWSIPLHILEKIYADRALALVIEAGPGNTIDPRMFRSIKESIQLFSRNDTCNIGGNGGTITLSEFSSIGATLMRCKNIVQCNDFKNADKLIALSEHFIESQFLQGSGWKAMHQVIWSATTIDSKLNERLYWGTVCAGETFSNGRNYSCFKVQINSCIQEKVAITLEGNKRPMVRVGWADYSNQPHWCEREASLFGLPQSRGKLPVYIQMHALNRVEERLDCSNKDYLHYMVYESAKEGKVHKGPENTYLIAFKYFERKAGYLSAVVHEGKLVIRTFLFLTNNGTPEGKKLHDLTGLQKHDKKYLLIDKLSTFMNPEFRRNETIRRLFFDAGCGDLFELTKDWIRDNEVDKNEASVQMMMDYMMLKPVDAEAPPDFSDAFANGRYR